MKASFEKLTKLQLKWNGIGADTRSNIKWAICNVFQGFSLTTDGHFKFRFTEDLVSEVLAPRLYAYMKVRSINMVSGLHAKRIYEILIETKCRLGRNHGGEVYITDPIPLEDLRSLLGLSSKHKDFKYFNRDVIQPSVLEISRQSDCRVSVHELVREKRRVVAICFKIEVKDMVAELPLFSVAQEPDHLVSKLKKMGLDIPSEYLARYSREVVESAVQYTEAELAAGEVKKFSHTCPRQLNLILARSFVTGLE